MKIYKKINKQKGSAMLISVMFFMLLSFSVALNVTVPVVRESYTSNKFFNSKQSLATSESGAEDVFYRLKSGLAVDTTETINLGGATTTTTTTTVSGNQKTITSSSSLGTINRNTQLSVTSVAGTSFSFAVQVGQGGLNLNSSTINGSVYSNGPITGNSSAVITGSATSANSPALLADQSNGSGVPANNVTFANALATQDVAQSFQLSTSSPLNKVELYIKKTSTPSDATVKIVNDNSGSPGTTIYATGTLSASLVSTNYGWVPVSFSTNPLLVTATTYWFVIDAGNNASRYYILGGSTGGYANGSAKIGQQGSTWNVTTPTGIDYSFKLYLGGFNGSIASSSGSRWNPLHVGTVSGNAYANTVNYTNVLTANGTIYCQSGTGNSANSSNNPLLSPQCNTSQADPVFAPYPISDANISDWEDDALAGGIYSGNYAVGYAGATLGPKKIVGNLNVSSGGTLTVSGTLWVTGNMVLDGGGRIQLASSYGSADGLIIVDGTITVSGGGFAAGSGTTGSYIMLISKSVASGAITIAGGSGAVIAYAKDGGITLSGGVSLKEAVGYSMTLLGNSTITYESGLADLSFSSGPSGTWDITSWKETE